MTGIIKQKALTAFERIMALKYDNRISAMQEISDLEEVVRTALTRSGEAEKRAPVQGLTGGIPWSMHLRAYDAYCKKYGRQQALIEGNCRGGFGTGELDAFIPGWRDELSEITRLKAHISELEAEAKLFDESNTDMGRMVDRIADLIGVPHDQELTQDAFELWFATHPAPAVSGEGVIHPGFARSHIDDPLDKHFLGQISGLCMETDVLRSALRDLLEACQQADALGELYETIDGKLMHAAQMALDGKTPGGMKISYERPTPPAAELREAMKPFADAAALIPPEIEDFKIVASVPGGKFASAFTGMSASITAGNLRRIAALSTPTDSPADGEDVRGRSTSERYALKWIAAPRPPVHPKEMEGNQTFLTLDKALTFMSKQAPDARFVSLSRVTTSVEDVSDQALQWLKPGA